MDLRQTEKYGNYMEEGLGWKVVEINDNRQRIQIFIRSLGVFGAIAKIQRVGWPIPWRDINIILKENKVWMCKIEPDIEIGNKDFQNVIKDLGENRFKQDKWPLSASKTICLNLSVSLEEIEKQMKKDAKYCLRKSRDSNIKLQKNDFSEFYDCWRKGSKIKSLWIPAKDKFMKMVDIFGDDCFCLTALNQNKETIGGVFVLFSDQSAYYYYSTSLPEGKKLNAPYLLMWESITEAKKRGCLKWDFEGIYDSRFPIKGWEGFSHFKKSFGGEEISYVGSFTKWMLPI